MKVPAEAAGSEAALSRWGKNVRSGRAKRTSMTGAAVGMPETVRKGGAGAVGRAENRARMRYARI